MFDIRNRKEIKRVKPEELYTEVEEYTTEEELEEEQEEKEVKEYPKTSKFKVISDIIFMLIIFR